MYNTYENFKEMLQSKQEGTVKRDFELSETFVEDFKESQDPRIIAAVYVSLYGYLKKISAKYFRLDMQDKASFITEEIWKALMDFDSSLGVPFPNFLAAYVNRRCYAENKMREHNKRKIDYDTQMTCSAEELGDGLGGENDDYVEELMEYINSSRLNDTELLYCRIVSSEPHRMTDSEVARLIGVSPANINYIRKRLQNKIQFA